MEASDFVRVACEEFQAAMDVGQRDIGFAGTASAVRSHMRSAAACLLSSAVLSARARREVVGQRHFEWDTPPRGGNASQMGHA